MTERSEHNMVVEVTMLTDEEMLHENDVDEHGNCKVDGMYFLKLVNCDEAGEDPVAKAREIVEKSGLIDCVSDFDFFIREANQDEVENVRKGASYFRSYLGSYTIPIFSQRPGM